MLNLDKFVASCLVGIPGADALVPAGMVRCEAFLKPRMVGMTPMRMHGEMAKIMADAKSDLLAWAASQAPVPAPEAPVPAPEAPVPAPEAPVRNQGKKHRNR